MPAIARMRVGRWILAVICFFAVFILELVVVSQTWLSLGGRVT